MPTDSTLNIKITPYNPSGVVDAGTVSPLSITTRSRFLRPYPPGNLQIGTHGFGVYPATVTGDLVVSWSTRNRLTQFGLVRQDASDIAPEAGTTFKVLTFIAGVLIRTTTGLSGPSFTYVSADRGTDDPDYTKPTTLQIFAVRDGLDSYFPLSYTCRMIGVSGILAPGRFEFSADAVGGLLL